MAAPVVRGDAGDLPASIPATAAAHPAGRRGGGAAGGAADTGQKGSAVSPPSPPGLRGPDSAWAALFRLCFVRERSGLTSSAPPGAPAEGSAESGSRLPPSCPSRSGKAGTAPVRPRTGIGRGWPGIGNRSRSAAGTAKAGAVTPAPVAAAAPKGESAFSWRYRGGRDKILPPAAGRDKKVPRLWSPSCHLIGRAHRFLSRLGPGPPSAPGLLPHPRDGSSHGARRQRPPRTHGVARDAGQQPGQCGHGRL